MLEQLCNTLHLNSPKETKFKFRNLRTGIAIMWLARIMKGRDDSKYPPRRQNLLYCWKISKMKNVLIIYFIF